MTDCVMWDNTISFPTLGPPCDLVRRWRTVCVAVVVHGRLPLSPGLSEHRQSSLGTQEDHTASSLLARATPTLRIGGHTHVDPSGRPLPHHEWRAPQLTERGPKAGPLPCPELAFTSAKFEAIAPESVFTPPPAVLKALQDARRIIVVSHVPPDGDCVGTALGVARALSAMGKTACAVVDTELPKGLRGLDDRGDLLRAKDVQDFNADLVLLVDVAQADRIGGARALLQAAPAVAVIDHHRADPNPATLGLKPGTPVAAWVDENADSASLMAAAAVRTLAKQSGGIPEAWDHVTDPLAAGAATDTGWFSKSSTRQSSLHIFKHLLGGSTQRLKDMRNRLAYELPQSAQHLLNRAVKVKISSDHGHSAVWMSADRRTLQEALQRAQRVDPDVTLADVSGTLMNRLDRLALEHGVAVLLQDEPDGQVRISTRSTDPEVAGNLARAVGGGGKEGAGGAVLDNSTLMKTRQSVQRVLNQWVLGQTTQLRLMGSI